MSTLQEPLQRAGVTAIDRLEEVIGVPAALRNTPIMFSSHATISICRFRQIR